MSETAPDFAFTDAQWSNLAHELRGIGRLDSGGERWLLEMLAGTFIHTRRVHKKGRLQPKKAREVWLKVASAADELQCAIGSLRPAGAADFSMLDNHSERIEWWASFLPSVVHGSRIAAEYEMFGVEATGNNTDPMRDHFLRQVVDAWIGYGGKVRASVDADTGKPSGPLIRFVAGVTEPAFAAMNESPPTLNVIRAAVRGHPAYGK